MIDTTHRTLAALAATLFTLSALAADKTFERHFTAAPGGHLSLDGDSGSVTVRGHAGREVIVRADISGSDAFVAGMTINAEQVASGVQVTAHQSSRGSFHWFSSSGDRLQFTIDVPEDYAVELRSSGGDLDIRDIKAAVNGRTSGGNITVSGVRGMVALQTSGGDVDVQETGGTLDIHTSGGNIRLQDVDGGVNAETSGGDIHAAMRSNHGISLSTSGGEVTLLLPASAGAELDARTSGGSVTSALPLTRTEQVDGSRLRGSLHGGGEAVRLHTSGGNIHIGPLT